MKKRVFVAIEFPLSVKKQIGELVGELRKNYPQIRWEKEENLHLTLKFLGWVEIQLKIKSEKLKMTEQNEKLGEILKGMERATEGIRPFWFQPTTIGYFLRESLIIWLGAEVQEGLLKLVENLEKEMVKIGFPKEKRPFTPHITLGRLHHARPASQWRQVAQNLKNFKTPQFEKFKVKQIILMESQPTPSGSIYTPLQIQSLIFS